MSRFSSDSMNIIVQATLVLMQGSEHHLQGIRLRETFGIWHKGKRKNFVFGQQRSLKSKERGKSALEC